MPERPRWVRQQDDDGCGVACLAMLTGQSYADVDNDPMMRWRHQKEASRRDLQPHHMTRYLWDRGLYLRKITLAIHAPEGKWPPLPFAEAHYAMVKSPTGPSGHWVVVDQFGGVLDPFDEGRTGLELDFYGVVNEIVGVVYPNA